MSNGITIQYFFTKFLGLMPNGIGFTKFHENRLRIDRLDTEKLTLISDHPPPWDRL